MGAYRVPPQRLLDRDRPGATRSCSRPWTPSRSTGPSAGLVSALACCRPTRA